jgi:glycosyltransferase involved in cell wall biosynthesis
MREIDNPDTGSRPRLALLHYTAAPVTGGVEAVMASQARLLREAGYDVRVIAGRGKAELIPELDSRHPEIEALKRRVENGTFSAEEFEAMQRRIADQLRPAVEDRDLVIVHNVMTMPFNLPLTAALLDLEIPLLAWTHDVAWTDATHAGFHRPGQPYSLLHEPHPRVSYVTISQARCDELAQAFELSPDNIAIVPNGIDPLEFAGIGPTGRVLLEASEALDADPLVLIPQRITPNKRLELALDVAAKLAKRLPQLHVIVTGPIDPHEGRSLAYAERLVKQRAELGLEENFHFLFEQAKDGFHPVDVQDVAQLYRMSDLVLLTSASEGFGLPLLESALARVPLVCSDIRPFSEIGGGAVYRFPADAPAKDIANLVEIALDEGRTPHRRTILRRYAWPVVLSKVRQAITAACQPVGSRTQVEEAAPVSRPRTP